MSDEDGARQFDDTAQDAADRAPASEAKKAKPAKKKQPAKSKAAKKSGGKDGKKGKDKGKKGAGSGMLTVATHPRASGQIRRAKGWGGLLGFGIAAWLSYRAQVPLEQIGLRALIAGIGGYMIAWACAITVWRHLMLAELRALADRHRAAAAAVAPPSGQAIPGSEAPEI